MKGVNLHPSNLDMDKLLVIVKAKRCKKKIERLIVIEKTWVDKILKLTYNLYENLFYSEKYSSEQ